MAGFGPDTIEAFELAARARFEEGTILLNDGYSGGAVYLFGYVAELMLKSTAFRLLGHGRAVEIASSTRDAVQVMMKMDTLKPRGQHDILNWAKWVVLAKPDLTGVAYPTATSALIEECANRIDSNWHPDLRYRAQVIPFLTALVVQQAARWLLDELPKY
jgi:hypothetical protein